MIVTIPKTTEDLEKQGREIANMIAQTTIEQREELFVIIYLALDGHHQHHTAAGFRSLAAMA